MLFPRRGYRMITARHLFGWAKESELKGRLESFVGTCSKTAERYDSVDFTNQHGWKIELKARRAISEAGYYQDENSFDTWLVPECKKGEGIIIFFYYWEASGRLWYCMYDKEDFKRVECRTPPWSKQSHFWIPRHMWREVLEDEELTYSK